MNIRFLNTSKTLNLYSKKLYAFISLLQKTFWRLVQIKEHVQLIKIFFQHFSCSNRLRNPQSSLSGLRWWCIVNSQWRMCKIKFLGRRAHPTTIFLISKLLSNWDIMSLERMANLLCCTVRYIVKLLSVLRRVI